MHFISTHTHTHTQGKKYLHRKEVKRKGKNQGH